MRKSWKSMEIDPEIMEINGFPGIWNGGNHRNLGNLLEIFRLQLFPDILEIMEIYWKSSAIIWNYCILFSLRNYENSLNPLEMILGMEFVVRNHRKSLCISWNHSREWMNVLNNSAQTNGWKQIMGFFTLLLIFTIKSIIIRKYVSASHQQICEQY